MPATLPEVDTDLPNAATDTPPQPASGAVSAAALQDRFPEWFHTSRRGFIYSLLLGVAFGFFSFRPLWHTDLWGHLAYGRLIVQTGAIPEFEPFLPLAEGVPLVDTAWLSQVIGYGFYSAFGVTALQFLYAAGITLCLALLAWRFHHRTQSVAVTLAGLAVFLWVEWQALLVVRPQLAGLCCFVFLLVLMTSRQGRRAEWFLVPLMMAGWANLHGSFLLGILLLGTLCVGRGMDVWRRTGRLSRVWRDARTRRLLLLTELAAAAVLVNPYGIHLFPEVFAVASHPNLQDLLDWQPLTLRMKQGQAAFAVALLLIGVMRISPRRVTAAEGLLLAGLGAAALWTSRLLVWWAPVATLFLVLHGHAVLRRRARRKQRTTEGGKPRVSPELQPLPERSLWTVASLGVVWIVFAMTPFGSRLLHGHEPKLRNCVSSETPIEAASYLTEHPPEGLIFNPAEWGDYLIFAGPEDLPVFANSHVHLIPEAVWQDSLRIDAGWTDSLDRYGVNTVVVNPVRQPALRERLRHSGEWTVAFQDARSEIFVRGQ